MNSSISSSDPSAAVRRDRKSFFLCFFLTFLLILIVIFCINYCFAGFPKVIYINEEHKLTAYKIFAPEKYDMVITGSSRLNYGMDPDSMKSYFPGMRIHNCSMFGGSINRQILEYVRKKLDMQSGKSKIVLMEFSSRIMWNLLRNNDCYNNMIRKSPDEIRNIMNYSREKRFSCQTLLMPMSRDRWNQRRRNNLTSIPICHPDTGWFEVVNISEKEDSSWRKRMHNMNNIRKADPKAYQTDVSFGEILEEVRAFRKQGVLVIGIQPPVYEKIQSFEDFVSSYDRKQKIADFEAAGGIFLEVPGEFHACLGGSHLDSETAKRYSMAVSEALCRELAKRNVHIKH